MINGYLGKPDTDVRRIRYDIDAYKKSYESWLETELNVRGMYNHLVFEELFDTPFVVVLDEDQHRVDDGLDLRSVFTASTGAELDPLSVRYQEWDCSALEVIVALAMAMDQAADTDKLPTPYRERGAEFFYWDMIQNLSLRNEPQMGDWAQKRRMIQKVVSKWMERRYSRDGTGGLFPVKRSRKDQRKVELWFQMQEYLHENHFV